MEFIGAARAVRRVRVRAVAAMMDSGQQVSLRLLSRVQRVMDEEN